jgi:hypothetical protein
MDGGCNLPFNYTNEESHGKPQVWRNVFGTFRYVYVATVLRTALTTDL